MEFIKNLGKHTLYAFIGGIIIWFVVVASFLSIEEWNKRSYEDYGPRFNWKRTEETYKAIKIETHRKENTNVLTVTGTIKNTSGDSWRDIKLDIDVYVNNVHVNSCSPLNSYSLLDANEVRGFKVECSDVDGNNWPSSMRYEIAVDPIAYVAHNKSSNSTPKNGAN